ncbi:hypothetical protein B6S59_19380 [Pseudomonas sp. A46]|nr:hypothetical protein [Pseudomonas sp. A46]OWJ92729.1 hypothetical protein B6S59_19380 [Pseudomonas sp. A46]
MVNLLVIHHAHPLTGEYLGPGQADPDPMAEGAWLIPAHAYIDAPPPAGRGEAIVRTEQGWQAVPDLRGTVYETATGAPVQHHELGPLPEHLTHRPRTSPDHRWAGSRWQLDRALQEENRRQLTRQLWEHLDTALAEALSALDDDSLALQTRQLAILAASSYRAAGYPEDDIPAPLSTLGAPGETAQATAERILQEDEARHDRQAHLHALVVNAKEALREAVAEGNTVKAEQILSTTLKQLPSL